MPQNVVILLYGLCVLAVSLLVYLFVKFWNTPVHINNSWVGTTFYVFKHEKGIAEMIPVEEISSIKENKGRKFFIPESFGKLETGKTYDLLEDKDEKLYFKQVAVMLG